MFAKIRDNYEFYKKDFYKGDDIYCPFCSGFYKAKKYRFTKQLNTNCPVCSSTIEERTLLLFLLAKTEILPAEPKILIIAEKGRIPDYFRNYPNAEVKVYSITSDFTIRDNTLNNKFQSESFDLIVCNYILEKHPDHIIVLKELIRILKPTGIMLLQAKIDHEKEETVEFSHMYYKDRLLLYGIPGNLRRFGKDYPEFIKSHGLNLSRLKFTEGFEILPEYSLKKDEIIYLAYKTDNPLLFDNMDDLEAEMSEQRSYPARSSFSALIYTVFFILPELFQNSVFSFWSNINENEHNKGKFIYMVYVIIFGMTSFWGSFIFYRMSRYFSFQGAVLVHFFIALPVFVFIGGLGFTVMGGYILVNDKAGIIKQMIVGILLSLSMLAVLMKSVLPG